ncbi:MAG: DUF4190 domain-containing protein [Clostridia bacterium]|nr:DUF4190 domain-containing protein [Clostridia bacterium]
MNNDYNNPNQNQGNYGSNTQNGQNQGSFYTQQQSNRGSYGQPPFYNPYTAISDPHGSSAQTFGIIAVVSLVFCQIVSLVLGILAVRRAKDSRTMLQFETGAAKTGRICGWIGIILGAISIAAALLYILLIFFIVVLELILLV